MKNFVVTSESVKSRDGGLASLQNYLIMENHPNHIEKTEKIILLHGANSFRNIVNDTFTYEAEELKSRQEKGVRGRYKLDSFAHSFALTIPKMTPENTHVRPTKDQWGKILKDVAHSIHQTIDAAQVREREPTVFSGQAEAFIEVSLCINKCKYTCMSDENGKYEFEIDLPEGEYVYTTEMDGEEIRSVYKCENAMQDAGKKYDDITFDDITRVLFANVHQQKDGNDHLNLMLGKIIKGHVVKEITQKAMLANIKSTYTKSLFIHCGMDIENYKPVRTGRPEKRVSVAQAKQFALKETLESIKSEHFEPLGKPLRNLMNNLKKGNEKGVEKWKQAAEERLIESYNLIDDESGKDEFESGFNKIIVETDINNELIENGFEEIATPFAVSVENNAHIKEIENKMKDEEIKNTEEKPKNIFMQYGI